MQNDHAYVSMLVEMQESHYVNVNFCNEISEDYSVLNKKWDSSVEWASGWGFAI